MRLFPVLSAGVLAAAAACGGGGTGPNTNSGPLPTPSVACANVPVTQLAAGEHAIVNPAATTGCLRLPAAGPAGAQYLLVAASTSSQRTTSGVQGGYLIRASSPGVITAVPDAAPSMEQAVATPHSSVAAQFDATLREKERELSTDPANRPGPLTAPTLPAAPPAVGDTKDFKVCTNLQCSAFGTVSSTVQYVGQHVAIYLDNTVPSNDPLQPADFAELGTAFDTYHYGIDTTAFGRESDLDNNGVVDILMTDAVNALTPDCTNGRVIGYFYGGDLLTGPNSNRAEVFYTLVPAPATSSCTGVGRRDVLNQLKPTLIHEFQHMISYNQHVLVRQGVSEETWLNEGMSHFAEELAGRLIPNSQCPNPPFPSCRSQYSSGNILDAYDFLKSPESFFLVYPNSSTGTLEERGASWLFLRWVLDQYDPDPLFLATATTRALVATNRVGADNLTHVTGGDFPTMVPEWLMAVYLDDGDELPVEPTGRLRYNSWGLRAILTDPRNQQNFPLGFPLTPVTMSSGYSLTSILKGGTGKHFRIAQESNGRALDIQVLKSNGDPLDPALVARFGIVRIR